VILLNVAKLIQPLVDLSSTVMPIHEGQKVPTDVH